MLQAKIKKKYNLLLLQAKFLKAKLDLNQDIFEEAQKEFAEAYNAVCKTVPENERKILQGAMQKNEEKEEKKKPNLSKAGRKAKENNRKKKQAEQEPTKTKNPESKKLKKIYRAIARESHPDKLVDASEEEASNKEKLFREAQEASDQVNLVDLIEIAENLNIKPPDPEPEHLEILEKNIKNIKNANKMITDTTAWQWHHTEGEQQKSDILIRYMQYIYTTFK
tara:strand:+ start:186 stop:854 length:669 start_codon:yes stop_codon:yes gene_type:complete